MTERAAYSRVYWSIVDDEKFVTIYDSDAHLAGWLRLLLIADQAHPASAHLPSNVRKSSVKALAAVELIDLQPGGRYRVHGLDAERGRRAAAATRPGPKPDPTGTRAGPKPDPEPPDTTGLRRDETRQDEDETSARDGLPSLDRAAIRALEERTGHTWSQAGEKQLSEYDRLVTDHGLPAVLAAFDAVSGGKRMTARQLIWPALRLLEPFVTPKADDTAAQAERFEAHRVRVNEQMYARRIERYRFTGEWDPEWGDPPKVEQVSA